MQQVRSHNINYSAEEIQVINLNRASILNDIKILGTTPKSVIYEKQEVIARDVVDALSDRKVANVMVIAKTQSRKTGCTMAVINYIWMIRVT